MSWKEKSNVFKIFNAFKRNRERVYESEIEALKDLDDFINQASKTMTHGNIIYAKILALYLIQNIEYYKGVKEAVKSLKNELKKPLDYQLQILTMQLNSNEIINYLKTIKVLNEIDGKVLSEIDKINLKKNEKEIIEKLKNSWTNENVDKSFYNTANDLLKEIENYI